ncbi:MAG: cytochrome-c peroxidase [Sphingobacteriales bacterium]|nr:MAG: cytochrome-c peroxidase [Sphingobacteriales bacterium]
MKNILMVISLLTCWLVITVGCKKNDNEAPQTAIRFVVPSNFPTPVYQFTNNTVSNAGFDLGHRLFYENALSIDNSTNCGSCHQQFAAFANLDHQVSHGVNNCFGTRNSPPLFNLAWQQNFMWDGGVHHIELSALNAFVNPCEMANTLDNVVKTLNNKPSYPQLFISAFGSSEINSQRIFKALAQFTGMMVSANSKYDKYSRKQNGGEFTNDELAGYALFKQKCSSCHTEPLFTDNSFKSNGLELNPKDAGREIITLASADFGAFRVPTLRNVALTSPYMHNGSLSTLAQVLNHYNSGVKNHINLDAKLKQNGVLGIPLSATEQQKIITFLNTLTDNEFIHDPKFAELPPL